MKSWRLDLNCEQRVFDTPLTESAIAGVSVGLALAGWHPVAEMQFDGFSYPALDQVISHVAKYRYRSRGRQPVPLVIRIPFAGGVGAYTKLKSSVPPPAVVL